MDWHSTRAREELLIALDGRIRVEVLTSRRAAAPRTRQIPLNAGECLYLPRRTQHRVLNMSRTPARYLYVTAPAA